MGTPPCWRVSGRPILIVTALTCFRSGGFATAIVTSPLDVLRTRLQSDLYQVPTRASAVSQPSKQLGHSYLKPSRTTQIISSIYRAEGWPAFFRGLGPSLAGVVPATAIKFYVYGNCKRIGADMLGYGEGSPFIHAQAAICAGIATATSTNPIWVVKTRLQLDKARTPSGGLPTRRYQNSVDCLRKVVRHEGLSGLYRGLSASYLGSVETALHLVLYERLKSMLHQSMEPTEGTGTGTLDEIKHWISTSGAAGAAKLAAGLITYPHEVREIVKIYLAAKLTFFRWSEQDCARRQWEMARPNIRAYCNVSVLSVRKKAWQACMEA